MAQHSQGRSRSYVDLKSGIVRVMDCILGRKAKWSPSFGTLRGGNMRRRTAFVHHPCRRLMQLQELDRATKRPKLPPHIYDGGNGQGHETPT